MKTMQGRISRRWYEVCQGRPGQRDRRAIRWTGARLRGGGPLARRSLSLTCAPRGPAVSTACRCTWPSSRPPTDGRWQIRSASHGRRCPHIEGGGRQPGRRAISSACTSHRQMVPSSAPEQRRLSFSAAARHVIDVSCASQLSDSSCVRKLYLSALGRVSRAAAALYLPSVVVVSALETRTDRRPTTVSVSSRRTA